MTTTTTTTDTETCLLMGLLHAWKKVTTYIEHIMFAAPWCAIPRVPGSLVCSNNILWDNNQRTTSSSSSSSSVWSSGADCSFDGIDLSTIEALCQAQDPISTQEIQENELGEHAECRGSYTVTILSAIKTMPILWWLGILFFVGVFGQLVSRSSFYSRW